MLDPQGSDFLGIRVIQRCLLRAALVAFCPFVDSGYDVTRASLRSLSPGDMAEYKILKLATGHLPVDGFFKHQRGQVHFWPTAKGPAVILTVPEASRSAEAFQTLREGVFRWSLRCAAVLTLLYAVSVAIVFYSQPDLTEPEAEYSSGITVLAFMAPCVSSVFLIGHLIGATRLRRLKLREANRLHSAGAASSGCPVWPSASGT